MKYKIVIIAKYGVNLDISNTDSSIPGSRKSFADIKAVATNKHTCTNPTIPIPIVFPNTIVFGLVEVTNVSIIFDVFSVVIELDT